MRIIVLSLSLISILIALIGCSGPNSSTEGVSSAPSSIAQGITLTPKSFSQTDFPVFLERAKEAGSFLSWSGDWIQLDTSVKDGPEVTSELSKNRGLTPVIIAQFFSQSSGKLLRPLDEKTKKDYLSDAVAFAQENRPPFMAFGIEINVLYEKNPAHFDAFVQFYDALYDAVKAASPQTKVFVIFQLERMKGLRGGLFGGKNDESKAEWFLLDKFSKADLIGFTTYPNLIYKNPVDIPLDYYTEITAYTKKPIAFTEVGWHSAAAPAGWESSEEEQHAFVEIFFDRLKKVNTELVIWSFLYDQNVQAPFNSAGFFRDDGTPKKAWDRWKDFQKF